MVLDRNAELSFYLDGVMRDSPKLTEGEPNRQDFYRWSTGKIHLGYFKVTIDAVVRSRAF